MKPAFIATPTRGALIALVIALPWLNPFASGPSPAVLPWLLALAAAASLMLLVSLHTTSVITHGGASFARRWAHPAALAWALAGGVSSAIGLLQYFGAAAALEPWVNQAPLGVAFANLRQRNQFATLTNIALAALLWWVVQDRPLAFARKPNVPALTALLVMLMVIVLAVGNAASSSRTGLLQTGLLVVLTGIWGGLRRPQVRRVLLAFGFAYVVALLVLPWLAGLDPLMHGALARMRTGDAVCASRLTLWSNVLHLIAQKPWLGWGWGELDYAHYITLYDGPRFCEILDNAHNLPLHLAVELGVPAALLLCGGFVWWVWRQQPWRELDATRQLAWTVLAVIGLHSLLEYPLWYGPFQMAAGLCVLMLWRSNSMGSVQKFKPNRPLAHTVPTQIAIVLIAIAGYAMWDYHRISQIYRAPEAHDAAYRDDTMAKIHDSWLFRKQVRFAELSITTLTQANTQWTFDTATALLHYSPEPRVIEKVIESAVMLGRDEEALAQLTRYRAAFPAEHARWAQENAKLPEPIQRVK
ncbi:Wzy polymerase domain-containing protein [Polaromonas sp. P1(28)-13]|nr:Wzy polymerase domain-containing protein [Polaromonas sp. P1(28)-13]